MKFYYGVENNYLDITVLVILNCIVDGIITILENDIYRSNLFTDPIYGTLKHIKYIDNNGNEFMITSSQCMFINLEDGEIIGKHLLRNKFWQKCGKYIEGQESRLKYLHKYIDIDHGDINGELPEQLMTVKYLSEDAKVLEIGGNIGRNSCIIASILKDDKNLVVLESHPEFYKQLEHNKNLNVFNFNIENSALSMVPLIQNHWITQVSSEVPDGWIRVDTITFEDLEKKYNIQFDTLVLDCEGAFYQILKDNPSCLTNINMVIIENDFFEIEKKTFVDETLAKYNLKSIYKEAGGWGPCYSMFYEVFKKIT